MAQTTKTMNPVVAQIPLEEWEMLAIRNINRKLAMAGVTGIEHGAVPGNGGTGATGKIPAVVLGFVGTKPGATRPEIRLVVAKKFAGTTDASLNNVLARLKSGGDLVAKGKPGQLKFYLPTQI